MMENVRNNLTKNESSFLLESHQCFTELADDTKTNSLDVKNTEPVQSYTLYGQRYLILLSFSLLTFSNGWMWIIWSPLTPDPLCKIWDVPESSVDGLSSLYMYLYILSSPLALYIVHHHGLRVGLITGASLNFIGSLIRFSNATDYKVVFIGTSFASVAQGFILSIPPLIASNWFGDSERAKATSIGVLANDGGVTFGLGATVLIDFQTSNAGQKLEYYTGYIMMISCLALISIVLSVTRDKPISPPSATAAHQNNITSCLHEENMECSISSTKSSSFSKFLEDFLAIFSSPSRIIFFFIYGTSVGMYYFMSTFMNQLFASIYSPSTTGWLGITLVLSGFLGSLWSASIIDKVLSNCNPSSYRENILLNFFSNEKGANVYWKMLMVLLVFSCANMFLLFVLLCFTNSSTANHSATVALFFFLVSGIGFSLIGVVSVGFEYGSAFCYPANEAIVGGMMNCSAEMGGWILNSIGGKLMDSLAKEPDIQSILIQIGNILVSILFCSCLLLWKGVKEEPTRLICATADDNPGETKFIL